MIDRDDPPEIIPLFAPDYRGSGLLLHINALPSPFGIGDVGPAAFDWVDRLQATGQQWWQALPLGPTGDGNSPSQSLSSFAGNALLVSPDYLVQDGLLRAHDTEGYTFPAAYIDYDVVILGADKWAQVIDPAWYGTPAARDAAVFRLPHVALAPRPPHPLAVDDERVTILTIDPVHHDVSATAVRAGRHQWLAPGAE